MLVLMIHLQKLRYLDARYCTSASEAEPIVPPSLINKSSTRVTIPLDAIVIAPVELAEPIVPPSLIKISSTKVTIPVDAIVIASEQKHYLLFHHL